MKKLYAVGYTDHQKSPSKIGVSLLVDDTYAKTKDLGYLGENVLNLPPILRRGGGVRYVNVGDILFITDKLSDASKAIEISNKLEVELGELNTLAQEKTTESILALEALFPPTEVNQPK